MSVSVRKSESVQNETISNPVTSITIRRLRETDLAEADRIFRQAFGTFIGLPDPMMFFQGRDLVGSRWKTNPAASLAVEANGELIASNFVTAWGSLGFFGPLTVRPDFWDRGVTKRLLEHTMPIFEFLGVRHAGLFTFPHSAKHIGLYQKFGFYPRFLTAVMTRSPSQSMQSNGQLVRFSQLAQSENDGALRACCEMTDLIFGGLDLRSEIQAVHNHKLGDTILLWNGSRLAAFAVCHFGAGTEGGPTCCYVKFAAARPGEKAGENFDRLLDQLDFLAANERLASIEAGVNMACDDVYRRMLAKGFQTKIQGVAMDRPNEPGCNYPAAHVISDWR